MRVSHDVGRLGAPPPQGAVASIGVFDGVHLGHQAILAANLALAGTLGAQPTVVTFASHPKQVLLGRAPKTLTTLEHRLELFRRAGIEHTLVLEFDERLRSETAEEFVERVLLRGLGAQAYVLGFDSKFGRDRRGTPAFLSERGYDVTVVDKVQIGQRAVSSTAIREAVELGDLEGARTMLGRPVSVLGTVVHGDALGRQIGFPTANLDPHHELHPPPGVYYGWVGVYHGGRVDECFGAVVNIGFRPTVRGPTPERPRVEVHLLDFRGDLYGSTIEFVFLGRLRGEARFADLEALKGQIALDVASARLRLSQASGEEPTTGR